MKYRISHSQANNDLYCSEELGSQGRHGYTPCVKVKYKSVKSKMWNHSHLIVHSVSSPRSSHCPASDVLCITGRAAFSFSFLCGFENTGLAQLTRNLFPFMETLFWCLNGMMSRRALKQLKQAILIYEIYFYPKVDVLYPTKGWYCPRSQLRK